MSGMIGDHQGRKSVEWYTPRWVFDELGLHFDLDPCSPFDRETCVPAKRKLDIFENGLSCKWEGRVWLNPPFGRGMHYWINKFIDNGNGVAMVFSRTDTAWCQRVLRTADATLFLAGRIDFVPGKENEHKKNKAGAGSMMFAYGPDCAAALRKLSHRGVLFYAKKQE